MNNINKLKGQDLLQSLTHQNSNIKNALKAFCNESPEDIKSELAEITLLFKYSPITDNLTLELGLKGKDDNDK